MELPLWLAAQGHDYAMPRWCNGWKGLFNAEQHRMHLFSFCIHITNSFKQLWRDVLILLCHFSHHLSVFLKDGWHLFQPLVGPCVELHVQRWEADKFNQGAQLCVGFCQSLAQQRHHAGLDEGTGQNQNDLVLRLVDKNVCILTLKWM